MRTLKELIFGRVDSQSEELATLRARVETVEGERDQAIKERDNTVTEVAEVMGQRDTALEAAKNSEILRMEESDRATDEKRRREEAYDTMREIEARAQAQLVDVARYMHVPAEDIEAVLARESAPVGVGPAPEDEPPVAEEEAPPSRRRSAPKP